MAINNVEVYIITVWVSLRYYTLDPMLFPSGNPFKCHEEVLYLQTMIPPKHFDISPLTGGCSEGLDAFRFFLKFTGCIRESRLNFFAQNN